MTKVIYDPIKVSISVNGVPVTGWADGDIFTADYEVNKVDKHVGTGGEGRFIVSKDVSGTATIRVADYSDANASLSLIDTVGVPVALTCTDKSSNGDLFFTEAAMVQKVPPLGKGNEAKINEWVFVFIRGTIVHAGVADI
ncbi:MAG: hypothetical protein KAT00_15350 [Planctomycetes bacterium]|nr:hypothetical protein [Planctomycetota bacterium]